MKSKYLTLITTCFCPYMLPVPVAVKVEFDGVILGRRIIGTAHGQGVVIRRRLHSSAFATTICRFGKDVRPPLLRRYR